jgi:hypothetical protein
MKCSPGKTEDMHGIQVRSELEQRRHQTCDNHWRFAAARFNRGSDPTT